MRQRLINPAWKESEKSRGIIVYSWNYSLRIPGIFYTGEEPVSLKYFIYILYMYTHYDIFNSPYIFQYLRLCVRVWNRIFNIYYGIDQYGRFSKNFNGCLNFE